MAASYQDVTITKLTPSQLNPRRSINTQKLAELTESIRENGIIEPLVVRKQGTTFEIVCGERRWRAATAAKLATVPVVVRTIDDANVLELALVENIQGEDLHPLDEAAAYAAMMKADRLLTDAGAGKKVGKSAAHVFKKRQLLLLSAPVKMAFAADRITAAHADRLTRVPVEKQADALERCFHPLFGSHLIDDDDEGMEPAPVARLDEWIARHVKEDLDKASVQHVFPDLLEQATGDQPEDVVPTLVQLSESHHAGADLETRKHGLVNAGAWTLIQTKKDHCLNMVQGVVVHGGPVRIVTVCAKKGCPKHRPPKPKAPTKATKGAKATTKPAWQVQQDRDEAARKVWAALKPKAFAAFALHVRDLKVTPALVSELLGWKARDVVHLLDGKKITAKNMGQAVALGVLLSHNTWGRQDFVKVVKWFGFKLGPLERGLKRQAAADARQAKKKTTKAATKKAAKRSTKAVPKKTRARKTTRRTK